MHQFVEYGLVNEGQFKKAARIALRDGRSIGDVLLDLGYISERKMKQYCHRILGF